MFPKFNGVEPATGTNPPPAWDHVPPGILVPVVLLVLAILFAIFFVVVFRGRRRDGSHQITDRTHAAIDQAASTRPDSAGDRRSTKDRRFR